MNDNFQARYPSVIIKFTYSLSFERPSSPKVDVLVLDLYSFLRAGRNSRDFNRADESNGSRCFNK